MGRWCWAGRRVEGMSAEVGEEKRARAAEGPADTEEPPAKKPAAAKESRACAGMSGKVGTGKDVEEFRNYEDSDRHSVRDCTAALRTLSRLRRAEPRETAPRCTQGPGSVQGTARLAHGRRAARERAGVLPYRCLPREPRPGRVAIQGRPAHAGAARKCL